MFLIGSLPFYIGLVAHVDIFAILTQTINTPKYLCPHAIISMFRVVPGCYGLLQLVTGLFCLFQIIPRFGNVEGKKTLYNKILQITNQNNLQDKSYFCRE